jgi:hypothetical protein
MDKRYFDNEPSTGCGGIFLLLIVALAVLGAMISG